MAHNSVDSEGKQKKAMNTPKMAENKEQENLRPFAATGLGWLLLGILVLGRQSGWFLAIWALVLSDFFVTAKLVLSFLKRNESSQNSGFSDLIIWGSGKTLCIGLLGLFVLKARVIPTQPLLMGLATLMIVPIVGAVFWRGDYARKTWI